MADDSPNTIVALLIAGAGAVGAGLAWIFKPVQEDVSEIGRIFREDHVHRTEHDNLVRKVDGTAEKLVEVSTRQEDVMRRLDVLEKK